jgi:sialate O-acetylesterase
MTAKNLPNTGIATAIDVGDENDIHPKDKKTVGQRLAMVAEKQVYGRGGSASGPTYKGMKIVGSSIQINFDHADGGLMVKGDAPLFAIAADDHKWYWASGVIDGSKITVSSPSVTKPVAVRYYWASFAAGSLYNGQGWPAFPFRTDDWKGITGG